MSGEGRTHVTAQASDQTFRLVGLRTALPNLASDKRRVYLDCPYCWEKAVI
jgi:hypothetical protein